jgi:ribosomal protein S27AE
MLGVRQAECPNCGAPIEWQLASSQAAVCRYCQFSVLRTDRELSALGRVADLVPTAAPLAVGDEGSAAGRTFRVLGRVQLDHGRGPWDEWYLGFDDGGWGWLARAEGRWYLTYEREPGAQPSWEQASLGARLTLAGLDWVVTERGGSAVVSAEGELPYSVDPRGSGRYADLEAAGGAFATLDFGGGSEPLRLFAGRELGHHELTFKRAALGPRPTETVPIAKLSCPNCGAPVQLFVPDASERVGCAHCGSLLDHTAGNLMLLLQLAPPPIAPLIPLGSRATLLGEERTVIGFMQRFVTVDGDRYSFREYLLYAASGYSWLLEENHHWLHLTPVATSTVLEERGGVLFDRRRYRPFAAGNPEVEFVIGEFYWKVMVGDRCTTLDYIAPPRLLSVERTANEISWSEGEYLEPSTLVDAFGVKLPRPSGVAPAQPNPHRRRGASWVLALLTLSWCLLAFAYECGHKQTLEYGNLVLPEASQQTSLLLTDAFYVPRGPTTIELELESPVSNGSVYVEASLIPEDPPGEARVLPLLLEHYQGYEGGESWSEGGSRENEFFGRVPAGKYSFRFVGSWEPYQNGYAPQLGAPPVKLTARVGSRSPGCAGATLLLLLLPWLLSRLRSLAFEAQRKQNENLP